MVKAGEEFGRILFSQGYVLGGASNTTSINFGDAVAPMFTNLLPVDITQPEDVADAVLFLASDESKYITAHEIAPDAGVTEF